MKARILILFLMAVSAVGSGMANPGVRGMGVDSLLPVSINLSLQARDRLAMTELTDIEKNYQRSGDHRKTLDRLLRLAGPELNFYTSKIRSRLFEDLARVTAKLRLYPLAMRCYYNARKEEIRLPADSGFYRELPVTESLPVPADSILQGFGDGKEASFYAMLLEVKQPIPGKRKAFRHVNNVGHTFITLIKYNQDGSSVSRSFGFYPHKTWFLSATPLRPSAPSVFKNDSGHEWDEAVGKLISYRQFQGILSVLRSYSRQRYQLNHRNCSDFGLEAARVGGIDLWDAVGHWPLGHGSNPGSAGQSLLEGKLADIGSGPSDGLLIIDNISQSR